MLYRKLSISSNRVFSIKQDKDSTLFSIIDYNKNIEGDYIKEPTILSYINDIDVVLVKLGIKNVLVMVNDKNTDMTHTIIFDIDGNVVTSKIEPINTKLFNTLKENND